MQTWEIDLYTDRVKPTEFLDTSTDVSFFVMNNKCYIIEGGRFLVYDGSTVVPIVPYVPTLQISKDPAGGGTANEDFNLIGTLFKDSFSADGTATVYQLSLSGLNAEQVSAEVNGTTINEGAGLTVDRVTGKVTFTTAPAKGTNNVIIKAGKTVSGLPDRIKSCRFSVAFGGANDTRIFLSGNSNMPEYVWRSGLYDPTYWPENGFYKYPETVKGFSKQYDYLVVERANGKHMVSYQMDETGKVSFPSKPINDQVGTVATKSIQIIENNPVSLSKNGVYMLTASNVRDERNVAHISTAIDRRLLLESSLENAVSIDFDQKYWLALNGKVFILDYSQKDQVNPYGLWYMYDNIHASHFLEMDGHLYFGSSKDGMVYRFKKTASDRDSFMDDGQAIRAYWKSKPLTFGADEMRKYIETVYFGLNPLGNTSINLSYTSDKKENILINPNKEALFSLFDFRSMDFSNFTFHFSSFPKEFKAKVKAKQITHFQLMIENSEENEGLNLLSLAIYYRYQSKIK